MTCRLNFVSFAARLLVTLLVAIAPLHAVEPILEPIPASIDAETDKVGATPGEFNVDSSGAATYSMPIFTAPAPGGVAPQLALSYSSRGGHGALGVGFGISGTSSIERCRKTIEHGDATTDAGKPIQWTNDDAYCLDGQRLIQIAATTTTNCPTLANVTTFAEFRTELESFARICAYQGDAISNGPSRFTVERRDGSIAQYGFNADARVEPNSIANPTTVVMRWALNRTRQPTGAYIDYKYSENILSVGEHFLTEVSFAGLESPAKSADAKVTFTYEAMPLAGQRTDYVAGSKVSLTQRLKTVSSYGPVHIDINGVPTPASKLLREYKLVYEANTSGSGLPRLLNIEECATAYKTDGTGTPACRPKTVLAWNSGVTVEPTDLNQLPNMGWLLPHIPHFMRPGDFNGDGVTDWLVWVEYNCSILGRTPDSVEKPLRYVPEIWLSGVPTALSPLGVGVAVFRLDTISVASGTSGSYSSNKCNEPRSIDGLFHIYDFNGDGRDDIMAAAHDPAGTELGFNVFLVKTVGASISVSEKISPLSNLQSLAKPESSVLSDFDADGLPDLLAKYPSGLALRKLSRAANRADGLTSHFDAASPLSVSVLNGGAPVAGTTVELFNMWNRPPQVADIDGDGRADAMLRIKTVVGTTTSERKNVFRNRGIVDNQLVFDQVLATNLPSAEGRSDLMDVNGDGLTDIVAMYRIGGVLESDITVWMNRGYRAGEAMFLAPTTTKIANYPQSIPLEDVNGDGYLDLVVERSLSTVAPSSNGRYARFGGVAGFVSTEVLVGASKRGLTNESGGGRFEGAYQLDLDADGDADRISIAMVNSLTGEWVAYRHTNDGKAYEVDTLKSITDGLLAKVEITYAPLTHSDVYKRHSGAAGMNNGKLSPTFDTFSPMAVVKSVKRSMPTAVASNMHETRYQYRGARVQAGGRGFLGFERRTEIDVASKIATTVQYRQNFPYIGQVKATLAELLPSVADGACANGSDVAGCLVYSSGIDSDALALPGAGGKKLRTVSNTHADMVSGNIHFPYLSESTETSYSIDGTKTLALTIDAWTYTDDASTTPACKVGSCGNLATHTKTWKRYDLNAAGTAQVESIDVVESTNHNYATASTTGWGNNTAAAPTPRWQLGLIGATTVQRQRFENAALVDNVTRTENFGYDSKGLLVHTVTEPTSGADLFLRTVLTRDDWGNVTKTVRCSNHFNEADCRSTSGFSQRQWEGDRTKFMRYSETNYSADGRFVKEELVPFYDVADSYGIKHFTFQVPDADRNALGQPTKRTDASGVVTESVYGAFGQEQFRRDNTGGFQYTKVRSCAAVTCPAGAAYRVDTNSHLLGDFNSANIALAPTALTYFDKLGREVLRTTRLINADATKQWSSVRTDYDNRGRVARVSVPHFTSSAGAVQSTNGTCNNIDTSSECWEVKEYDSVDRATLITRPDLADNVYAKTKITYDGSAREVLTETDQALAPDNSTKKITHKSVSNGLGETTKVIERIDSVDKESGLSYAAFGELAKITKSDVVAGRAGIFEVALSATFDKRGRKTQSVDPDKGTTNYQYNALGELIYSQGATLTSETRYYDALGRVHRKVQQYLRDPNELSSGLVDSDERTVFDQVSAATNQRASSSSAPMPELVTNGNFATSLTNWQADTKTKWQATGGNGNSSVAAVWDSGYLFQSSIAVDSRLQYQLSFWRKLPDYYPSTASAYVSVTHWAGQTKVWTDGATIMNGTSADVAVAVQNVLVTPYPGTTALKIEFRMFGAGGRAFHIDNVSLRAASPYPRDPMAAWTTPAVYQYGKVISQEDTFVSHKRHFSYDGFGRPVGESWYFNMGRDGDFNSWTVAATEYDSYGRVHKRFDPDYKVYASAVTTHPLVDGVEYSYASTGHLASETNLRNSSRLRTMGTQTARGQTAIEMFASNSGLIVTRGFDERTGLQTSQLATAKVGTTDTIVQDIQYSYDKLGNVFERFNKAAGKREVFAYDSLNRLKGVKQTNDVASPVATGLSPTLDLDYDAFGNIRSKTFATILPDGSSAMDGGTSIYGESVTESGVTKFVRPHAAKIMLKPASIPATVSTISDVALGMTLNYDNAGNASSSRWDRLGTNASGAMIPDAVIKRASRNFHYTFNHRLGWMTTSDQQRSTGAAANSSFVPDWDHGTDSVQFFDYGMNGEMVFRQHTVYDLTSRPQPNVSIPLYAKNLLAKAALAKGNCGNGNGQGSNGNGNGNPTPCLGRDAPREDHGRHLALAFGHDPEFLSAMIEMDASDRYRPLKYPALLRQPKDNDPKSAGARAKAEIANDSCATDAPPAVPLNDKLTWIFGNTEIAVNGMCDNARRRNLGYVNIEQRQSRSVNNKSPFEWADTDPSKRLTRTIYTYQLTDPLGSVDVQVRMTDNTEFTASTAQTNRNPRRVSFDAHGQQRSGEARSAVDNNGDGDTTDSGEAAYLDAWKNLDYFDRTRTRVEGTAQGYAGHQNFNHAGIVHMKGRIYDPTLGRFLQPDPIVEDDLNPQTWNRYTYVHNNPMTFTDPTGYVTAGSNGCAARCQADRARDRKNWVDTGGTISGGGGAGNDSAQVTPAGSTSGATNNNANSGSNQQSTGDLLCGDSNRCRGAFDTVLSLYEIIGLVDRLTGGGLDTQVNYLGLAPGTACDTPHCDDQQARKDYQDGKNIASGIMLAGGEAPAFLAGRSTAQAVSGGTQALRMEATVAGSGALVENAAPAASFSRVQLDKKYLKHAADFGVNSTKKNPETLADFERALQSHLSDGATVHQGTYGFVKDSRVFFNSNTNNAVVLDASDNFVTGFRLAPGTPQFENYLQNGVLR